MMMSEEYKNGDLCSPEKKKTKKQKKPLSIPWTDLLKRRNATGVYDIWGLHCVYYTWPLYTLLNLPAYLFHFH